MSKLKQILKQSTAHPAVDTRRPGLMRRFKTEKDGVAAIEFALIAPILIFMYLGLLEISMGIMADRDVSHATNVAGDLATQVEVLTDAELEDVLTAAVTVMGPQPSSAGDIRIHLESYDIDGSNNVRSLGSAKIGGPITKGAADLQKLRDMNLLTTTSGVVVATINYDYSPVGAMYFAKDGDTGKAKKINLHETFVLKPRRSASIPMNDASGNRKDFTCSVNTNFTVSCN